MSVHSDVTIHIIITDAGSTDVTVIDNTGLNPDMHSSFDATRATMQALILMKTMDMLNTLPFERVTDSSERG